MDSSLSFVSDSTLGQAYEQFVLYRNAVKTAMVEIRTLGTPVVDATAAAEPLPPIPDTLWCPACQPRLAGVASDACMKTKRFKSKGARASAEPDSEPREVCPPCFIVFFAPLCMYII